MADWTVMADCNESIWNFLLQQVKTLYLHYHNVYGHQTLQGGDLPWGAPHHKSIWPFDHVVLQVHQYKLKPVYLHYHIAYDHKT